MNRWRVGEDIGSKETDGCPLTDGNIDNLYTTQTAECTKEKYHVKIK
jgi:hypothetical protein